MRIGLYTPFLAALGGGERYLLTVLDEATRVAGAEVELISPDRPDLAEWRRRLGVSPEPGSFGWVGGDDAEVTARSDELDLLVAMTNDVPPLSHAARSVAVVQFPVRARDRVAERALAAVLDAARLRRAPAALASYDDFLCYSRFAAEWTRRRLGIEAGVLAPGVALPAAAPGVKEPRIVAVGRFFAGAHDKRHDVLIRAMGALARRLEGWTLHLVGGAGADAATGEQLARLRTAAAGRPVELHVNASAAERDGLYAVSALFWHAAGLGVNAARHPERLEHFGMTTVEAMAHGAVPLVVAAGGPAELVEDGVTGRHWRSVAELVERSEELARDEGSRERLAVAARAAAQPYGDERFRAEIRERVLRV